MKAFLRPTGLHSTAMRRVERALARHAPKSYDVTTFRDEAPKLSSGVEVVQSEAEADLVVLHAIGYPETEEAAARITAAGKRYAIIQYCLRTTQKPDTRDWLSLWQKATVVWSYFDLYAALRHDHESSGNATSDENWFANIYHAPLGVDASFRMPERLSPRPFLAMTSGYVSAPSAEAIEEVAIAAHNLGGAVIHVGPQAVEGMSVRPADWRALEGVTDKQLAELYASAQWVSGLRHGEGFELPVLEGLCMGARPIVFDRPDMRQWYDGHAVFVPECAGEELVHHLTRVMAEAPAPVTPFERATVLSRFDWQTIAGGFWSALLAGVPQEVQA